MSVIIDEDGKFPLILGAEHAPREESHFTDRDAPTNDEIGKHAKHTRELNNHTNATAHNPKDDESINSIISGTVYTFPLIAGSNHSEGSSKI